MNKEITITKDSISIPCPDTVTIPRSEYNELIAAKTICDMILSVADYNGYGCADTVKGLRNLDKYRKALTESEECIAEMVKKHDENTAALSAKVAELEVKLRLAESACVEAAPEETVDA